MLTHRNVPVHTCTCACTRVSVLHALEKDTSINIYIHSTMFCCTAYMELFKEIMEHLVTFAASYDVYLQPKNPRMK